MEYMILPSLISNLHSILQISRMEAHRILLNETVQRFHRACMRLILAFADPMHTELMGQ